MTNELLAETLATFVRVHHAAIRAAVELSPADGIDIIAQYFEEAGIEDDATLTWRLCDDCARSELELLEEDEGEDDDEQITCWCGAVGTFEELFDGEVFERGCGGGGILNCECGGDLCVCHNHGEVECPGCPECDYGDDFDDFFDDE